MEFLRFGSSIPGAYYGCCAVCIIQDFSQDPDQKASIELVDGDGGTPIVKSGETMFLGKTNREIFEGRLRIGTFNTSEMPNHVFLAVLTEEQISYGAGSKWLKILKENGFEFIRTTDNSVYTGPSVISEPGKQDRSPHRNYLFGLFRNIGKGAVHDPYTPPKEWSDLEQVVPEFWTFADQTSGSFMARDEFCRQSQEAQLKLWNGGKKPTFYTEAELIADGIPVTLAGRRSDKPQQLKNERVAVAPTTTAVSSTSPFGQVTPVEETYEIDPYDDDYY